MSSPPRTLIDVATVAVLRKRWLAATLTDRRFQAANGRRLRARHPADVIRAAVVASGSYANIRSLMTSDGNPYARFRRALATGNELLVLSAARELPQVALDDALRICLVMRDGDRARYDRAAVRWLGRFALEARSVTIADLRAAAAALDELPERTGEAMERLQRLCVARGVC